MLKLSCAYDLTRGGNPWLIEHDKVTAKSVCKLDCPLAAIKPRCDNSHCHSVRHLFYSLASLTTQGFNHRWTIPIEPLQLLSPPVCQYDFMNECLHLSSNSALEPHDFVYRALIKTKVAPLEQTTNKITSKLRFWLVIYLENLWNDTKAEI